MARCADRGMIARGWKVLYIRDDSRCTIHDILYRYFGEGFFTDFVPPRIAYEKSGPGLAHDLSCQREYCI